MGEDLSNQEKFQQMLATDKKVFEMLASMRLFLADAKSKTLAQYSQVLASYNELKDRYNARQNDYKTNSFYKLGNYITEVADKSVQWLKDTWNSIFGIGAVPLVVPVAIAAGVVITSSVVAYFIYKYYSETSTDYNEALNTLELLARHNPELAEKLADKLTEVKKQENSTGFFNQLGEGVKWGLAAAGVTVAGVAVYGLNKKYKWI